MPVVLDAGPLIYLAKLNAFDVLARSGNTAIVPASAFDEAARPELAFRHPEVAVIAGARASGLFAVMALDEGERRLAVELGSHGSGLHSGELDVLALGRSRGWPVCLHERQAARLARALGIATVSLMELLFAGAADTHHLEGLVRHFARLTNLAMDQLDELMLLIERRR